MKKNFLGFFAILLLMNSPVLIADATQTVNTETLTDEASIDFGTDSYDEDGCFC